ncbi:MAG: hypothetical protein V3U80_03255 [Flavobacteriaceae bacterium]
MKNVLIAVLLTFYIGKNMYAQSINTEVGLLTGTTSMQSDYGEREHFGSSYANIGFGAGAVVYFSADNKRRRWNDRYNSFQEHLRLRAEVSYMRTKLIHRGAYTQGSGANTILYNAMEGTSSILNYGVQIEYSIFKMSNQSFVDPYLSIGFLANSNSPQLISILGEVDTDPSLIPPVYNDGVFLDKNKSTSLIMGFGTRLRPKSYYNKSIYLVDFRWQKFNSDIVDGLNPTLTANKYNDWLLFFSLGYIFNFN